MDEVWGKANAGRDVYVVTAGADGWNYATGDP
jgi:hypothetical protein